MRPFEEPLIGGNRLLVSHSEFERSCKVCLWREQQKLDCDNAVVNVLCNAVRLSREYCDTMKAMDYADLIESIKALEGENARLRHDLMDPPGDIQELVIKKLNLVSAEALTQYRVALERWEWKLMDSAPRDGTRVLLLTSETCYVGYWSHSLWVSNAWIIYDTRSLKPDYWMPLPDPPATPLIEKGRK